MGSGNVNCENCENDESKSRGIQKRVQTRLSNTVGLQVAWSESRMYRKYKVGCVFTMVISSEFRMGQYRENGHREDEPHFIYDGLHVVGKF